MRERGREGGREEVTVFPASGCACAREGKRVKERMSDMRPCART